MADVSRRDRPFGDPDEAVPGRQLDPEARPERLQLPVPEPDRARRVRGDGVPRPDRRDRDDVRARTPRAGDAFSRWLAALVGLAPDGDDVVVILAVPLPEPVADRRSYADLVAATEPVDDRSTFWYPPDTRAGPVVLTVRTDTDPEYVAFSESPAHPVLDTRPVYGADA